MNNMQKKVQVLPSRNIEFLFTKDQHYLNQYYQLRRESYRNDNGWSEFEEFENEFDKNSNIAVALDNGRVVGGIRIILENECDYFSNEIPNTKYKYRKYLEFKNETTPENTIAEISSLVVNQNYRDNAINSILGNKAINFAKSKGIKYIFSVATKLYCRIHRLTYDRINYKATMDISYPWKKEQKYSNSEMFLIYTKFP
jgi:ribosomal protein S18 acetylase RimI-like enzyme